MKILKNQRIILNNNIEIKEKDNKVCDVDKNNISKEIKDKEVKKGQYYFLSENKNDFVDKLYDFKKRVNLPHKIVCPKNMVKELITNMTKKAPSPIYFNEPLSMGQKQCEKFKYMDLLIINI